MMSIVNESNLQSQNFAVSPLPNMPLALSKRRGRGSFNGSASLQSPSLRSSVEILSNANTTAFLELLLKVREGLQYYPPELCMDGVNGTYFLKDKRGENVAVFKPQDEEGNNQNNPKKQQLLETPLDQKFPSEKAALREVAASLLDREKFFDVPKTRLVKISYGEEENRIIKIGSLQEYVEHDGSSEDFGYKSFSVNDVHKIGILDIQMLNLDRHAGNILIKKSNNRNGEPFKLIPIDHGFSLPNHLNCSWFEWMNWPQAKIPFDDDVKSYVMRIDLDRDAHMLQFQLGIEPECIQTMQITVTLLKTAVQLDMTLYEIGMMVCRPSEDEPSTLEKMVNQAKEKFRTQARREIKDNSKLSFSMIRSVDRMAVGIPNRLDVYDYLAEIITDVKKSKSSKSKSKTKKVFSE